MTRLFNDPDDFLDELVDGFVAASGRWIRGVPGGVVRSTKSPEPTVALVVGGGSGHYPAFAGLVGPGLAHGAAMGNLFASPSVQRVHSVAAAADEGRGVLLSYGNYAGDVLNFTAAQDQLREEGVDCRTVLVTDDIWSAPADEVDKRRGIAGDLTVFKIAGAACEEGSSLDEVERLARLTNDRTRSFGVAFGGCTLPGAPAPLFTVPEGRMAVGLGIHGEPGIDETDVPTADGLAELFVSRLLGEVPAGVEVSGARVVPILNGLGTVKYEELFVVYKGVDRRLREAGIEVVDPEIGEFCTSFDMAGCSLTLLWLGNEAGGELERLWTAPADTPAFRRGSVAAREHVDSAATQAAERTIPPASEESREAAATIATLLGRIAAVLDEHADELGRMDSVAGDGDHGIGMQRGSRAGASAGWAAAQAGAGAGTTLAEAGDAWSDEGGGTSGVLWGRMLTSLGRSLGDDASVDAAAVAEGVTAAGEAVTSFGKAKVGDKTMIDAIVPFVDTLTAAVGAGRELGDAWQEAAGVAEQAAQATAQMAAKLGRARSHGDKSIGTPDPGAVSFALICTTVSAELARAAGQEG